jgi:hypothetical protein
MSMCMRPVRSGRSSVLFVSALSWGRELTAWYFIKQGFGGHGYTRAAVGV